jgi:hypothetical protein
MFSIAARNMERGYAALDALVKHGLSPAGARAIIQAFDPFHDVPITDPTGWPDVESGASVVRCYKQTATVAVPPGFVVGANWDCHVVAWPWLLAAGVITSTTRTGNDIQLPVLPVAGAQSTGGVCVYGVTAGSSLSLAPASVTCIPLAQIVLPSSVTAGSGRLVGYGFEVHNTTSELNKQGSCLVYRQQANYPMPQSFHFVDSTATKQNDIDVAQVRFPPATLADALLLNGSAQWEAKDGCYVVSNFMSQENPAFPIPNATIVISATNVDDLEGAVASSPLNVIQPTTTAAPFNGIVFPSFRCHPIHQSGAIFTGLSYTSTLTVNVNIYYEAFPSNFDKDILVLARPSASYDPKALLYYSELVQKAPVGVPVKMNGLGDWFAMGLSKLARTIGGTMKNLPGIPGMIGQAAEWAGETLPQFIEVPEKKKPQKQRAQELVAIPAQPWTPLRANVSSARKKSKKQKRNEDRMPALVVPTQPRRNVGVVERQNKRNRKLVGNLRSF